jgi:hypothetical protein
VNVRHFPHVIKRDGFELRHYFEENFPPTQTRIEKEHGKYSPRNRPKHCFEVEMGEAKNVKTNNVPS